MKNGRNYMNKKQDRKSHTLLEIHCFPLKEINKFLVIYTKEVASSGIVK